MPLARILRASATMAIVLTALAPAIAQSTPASASRIVSTVPAATLNLVLIGATDELVGVSKYDVIYLPENKRDLPIVGDYETINYEQLAKLKPTTLIIQTAESRIPPRLKTMAAEQKINLVNLRFDHVDDIWTSVKTLGKVAGKEADAQRAIEKAQADLKELENHYRNAPHPKVLYLVSPKLMLMCGGDTFIDQMITAAGGDNVGAKTGEGFVDVSRETMVKLAPDVLLIGAMEEPGEIANDPRLAPWLNLPVPAAKNKRIYLVTDSNSLMASVAIAKHVRALADLFHRGEPDPPAQAPASTAPSAAGNEGTGGR